MRARIFRPTAGVVFTLLLAAGPVLADDEHSGHQWMETSLYLQVSGAVMSPAFSDGISGSNAGGFDLVAGIRGTEWIAGEVQFELGTGMDPGGRGGTNWATTFNARLYPATDRILEGRVQPYALIGIGASSVRTETRRELGFASRFGGGVDMYLTEDIALTFGASYVLPSGTPVKQYDYVSVTWGVMYRIY